MGTLKARRRQWSRPHADTPVRGTRRPTQGLDVWFVARTLHGLSPLSPRLALA